MNRLWVRFSLAFTAVIVIAAVFPLTAGLLSDWLYDASEQAATYVEDVTTATADAFLSDQTQTAAAPLLTEEEIADLADILPPEKFNQVMNALYFYNLPPDQGVVAASPFPQDDVPIMGVLSPAEIEQLSTLLPPETYGKLLEFIDQSSINFGGGIMLIGLLPEDIQWMERLMPADEFDQLMGFFSTDETILTGFGGWESISLADILLIAADGLPQVIIVSAVLGLLLGILMSRSLTAPLSRLTEAAKAIGAQDLSRRVEVKGSREIKELANTLNQMAANLEEAEHLRRNMMADVSHELRTPLTVLEGNLRAALDNVYQLDEEDMAQLYIQTHHLTLLVDDLRELTLAEARKLPLDFQETDVAQLAGEAVAIFAPLARENNVTLNCRLADDLPLIEVDPARIRQVLHNLLSNALRHTPAGGEIIVAAERRDDMVVILVEDDGEGIAVEHTPQVFERFYRVDPARTRATGGVGLGLAIVRAIADAHHGEVRVHSEGLGKGCAFTISLPIRQPLNHRS